MKRQKMSNCNRGRDSGFTMVEVVVALTVVALIMTAVVSGISLSIKNTRVSNEKSVATRLAQETLEWVRGMRNQSGWEPMHTMLVNKSAGGSVVYCVNSFPANLEDWNDRLVGSCAAGDVVVETGFSREVEIELGAGEIEVRAVVEWMEGNVPNTEIQQTTLYGWSK